MSYLIQGPLNSQVTVLSGNTATSVFAPTRKTTVASVVVTPTSGTPNLTILKTDGTTTMYYRTAVTMTAGTAFVFDTPIVLDADWILKVQSSSGSGDMTVDVSYLESAAGAVGRT